MWSSSSADYRSGKRSWGVINAVARVLSAQDSADVAAHYATRSGRLQPNSGQRTPQRGRSFRPISAAGSLLPPNCNHSEFSSRSCTSLFIATFVEIGSSWGGDGRAIWQTRAAWSKMKEPLSGALYAYAYFTPTRVTHSPPQRTRPE